MELAELVATRDLSAEVLRNLEAIERLRGKARSIIPGDIAGTTVIIMEPEDCYLSAPQAGRLLGVNSTSVRKYQKAGLLPGYYLPDTHTTKYKKSDVLALPKRKEQMQ